MLMKITSLLCLFLVTTVSLAAATDRRFYLNSAVAPVNLQGQPNAVSTVTRQTLTASELNADQRAHFALKMRNFDELRARIAKGEVLSLDEMTSRYFPLPETWRKVAAWAESQGFSVGAEDVSHMTVAATSSVAKVQTMLQMQFARVRGNDGKEYTSAISAPAIPEEFRDCVAGVLQLQPHLRPRANQISTVSQIDGGFILPQTFAQLYNATGPGVDGRNETIAIIGYYQVDPADLTQFWNTCGLPTSIAQFTEIDLPPGPPAGGSNHSFEETMDIEWASAMAPGADVVYISNLSPDIFTPWIISQLAAGRPIHQVSTSFALPESDCTAYSAEMLATLGQYYATLAALGVSFFVSSGDGGSTQLPTQNTYNPNGLTSPYYPASDPSVMAVGGTTVAFQRSGFPSPASLPAIEGAWSLSNLMLPTTVGGPASGGGISTFFARPAWQTGPGIPAGTMRCVPDVAALAECNFSPYVQFNGSKSAAAGTSLSAPIWAGLCALINQARAEQGYGPLGLLGPKIYPLNGTVCFNQMTTGSGSGTDGFYATATNGAYMVGPNYNLVAGLGSPNIGNLILALTGRELPPLVTATPVITTQPVSQAVTVGGSFKFTAAASGTPLPTYQWQKNKVNISGATSDSYSIASATLADSGTYTVVATNSVGAAVSNDAALTVFVPTAIPIFTTQPQSQTVVAGSSVTFTAVANATLPPLYVWKKNGGIIFGAFANSYTINAVTGADAGNYSVVATTAAGSVTSNIALLTVIVPPTNAIITITVQ